MTPSFHVKLYHLTLVDMPKTRAPSFHPKDLGMTSVLKEDPSIPCLIPPIDLIKPRVWGRGWLFCMLQHTYQLWIFLEVQT